MFDNKLESRHTVMAKDIILQNVHKIAVLRANALGDFIFVLPALKALRQSFPDAEIVYLGKQWHADFIPDHVATVDRVVVVPPYPGVGEGETYVSDQRQLDIFFETMHREQFDIAFQMHGGGGNSNPFVKRLGARTTIGTTVAGAEPLDINIGFVFYQNEVLRYLELASLAGAKTPDIVPSVAVLDSDREAAAAVRKENGIKNSYIVIHPGATDPRRHWSAENFAAVARQFIEMDYDVVVTGTSDEETIVEAICTLAPGAANLASRLDLGSLAGVLAEARIVISNDTGPLHLAGALGTKTVGIYWIGNLISAGHMTHRIHRPIVSWVLACPMCGEPCVHDLPFDKWSCEHMVSFVNDISVNQVISATKELGI